jgi:hypothetical protein
MYTRSIVVVALLLLYNPRAGADKLQAAARGKKQLVQTRYGKLSSFDGTTLNFEEPYPAVADQSAPKDRTPIGPQATSTPIAIKDTEILIRLDTRDPQEQVDLYRAQYFPPPSDKKTTQVVLMDDQWQKTKMHEGMIDEKKKDSSDAPVVFDLTHCTGPPIDLLIETNPQANGTTKPPIWGKLQSVINGIVTFKRSSDGVVMKYRLDTLSMIEIGMCR